MQPSLETQPSAVWMRGLQLPCAAPEGLDLEKQRSSCSCSKALMPSGGKSSYREEPSFKTRIQDRRRGFTPEAKLYRWLQKLEPKARHRAFAKQFTETQRRALERWILKERVCDARAIPLASATARLCRRLRTQERHKHRKSVALRSSTLGRQSLPRSGSRGVHICTRGRRQRFCASALVGPFLVTTCYITDLSKVLYFREVLERMQARMAKITPGGSQEVGCTEQIASNFCEVLKEETQWHGPEAIAEMDLRFSVVISVKWWVGR
eukprot:TRINITY_DN79934_c0_g1_i1.p1 TRINITY_DN79934_c0_g1~~TRINITY_DN79934_c0_g1_i1.p1  ORF type:complete len:283 (+),score=47.22 TRINITY_DN79934_c0_g1_i1:52-849(+)